MPLLIDALQSGSEVFSRGAGSNDSVTGGLSQVDEVGLMLWKGQKV